MACCRDRMKQVARGTVGLTRSVVAATTGAGLADAATIERRRAICRACEHALPCRSNPRRYCKCRRCGCRLKHKTRLSNERCPLERW
ncbi:MAG: hypothetical protein WD009_13955 [Phycisphaeraceae bacterium]